MPFVDNQLRHETEEDARVASAQLMTAMSKLYMAFGELERRQVLAANDRKSQVVQMPEDAANQFDQIAQIAGDYPLNTSSDHPQAYELAGLYAQLGSYQYNQPLNNQDISNISSHEIRLFSGVVSRQVFEDSPQDWFIGRQIQEAANRLLTIGVITSRVSFLNSHAYFP